MTSHALWVKMLATKNDMSRQKKVHLNQNVETYE